MEIINNICLSDGNRAFIRDAGFVPVVQEFLHLSEKRLGLTSLAILAAIVNEDECHYILANLDVVKSLLTILGKGIHSKGREYWCFPCGELGHVVMNLARNDENKKTLVDLGALELLVEMGRTGFEHELHESVHAIWALSFDKEVQARVAEDAELGVVDFIEDTRHSQKESKRVRAACSGVLWTLKDALKLSSIKKYRDIGERLEKLSERPDAVREEKGDVGHIMLSYQWADQQTVMKIRDRIKGHGYKVWIDVDEMGGSTLQAMAEAVEGAACVLMCFSTKYKHSPNCHAEAEYAYQKGKRIIPLKMEQNYSADGWLGIILGTKLYYEFSGKYPFEDKMTALLKEIDKILRPFHQTDQPTTTSTDVQTTVRPKQDQPMQTPSSDVPASVDRPPVDNAIINAVRRWSCDDVTKWKKEQKLEGSLETLRTGEEVALLLKMQCEAPEIFYKYANKILQIRDLSTIARLVWSLDDIVQKRTLAP